MGTSRSKRPNATKNPTSGASAAPSRAVTHVRRDEVKGRLAAIDPAWSAPVAPPRTLPRDALLSALRGRDPKEREEAARGLGEHGDDEALSALRETLSDPEKSVRSAAAVSLVRLGDRALLAAMMKGLSDPSPRHVAGAAVALGLSRRREAVEPLLTAFRTHNTAVGAAIAGALGMIGDAKAVGPLLEALKADFVPADACQALGRLADARVTLPLVKALKHRDPKVRAQAARALGALRAPLAAANAKEPREKAVAALRKVLGDPSRTLRLAAALSLHELGDREASAKVVAILRDPSSV